MEEKKVGNQREKRTVGVSDCENEDVVRVRKGQYLSNTYFFQDLSRPGHRGS